MNRDREHMSRQCRAHLARCAAIEQERRLLADDLSIARQLRGEPPTREQVKRDTIAAARFIGIALVYAVLIALGWAACKVVQSPLLHDQDQPDRVMADETAGDAR